MSDLLIGPLGLHSTAIQASLASIYPQVRPVSFIKIKHLMTLGCTTEVMSLTSAGGCKHLLTSNGSW